MSVGAEPDQLPVVLVVDDDRFVRYQVVRALSATGAVVRAAASTAAALHLAETRGFDLDVLVTDWAVPELGGLELAARLRAHVENLTVVVASGFPDAAAACERAGAVCVRKPFAGDDMVSAVWRALER